MPPPTRSCFLHTIPTPPSLLRSAAASSPSLCSTRLPRSATLFLLGLCFYCRGELLLQRRTSLPPRRNLKFFPTARWSGRSSSSHNTAGHDPRTLSSPPNWLPMSLHGACRRNNHVAPREARAHNTPHATPSTDKSCTSRAANIPHSTTAPAPVGRHPSSTLSSPHHWLIHLSKARCVQSLPPRQCKARAHTIPHADAELRSWLRKKLRFENVRRHT